MSDSDADDEGAPLDAGQSGQSESDLLTNGIWHAPRGPKTRVAAWVILIAFAICVVAALVMIVALVLR